jgi:hypothetical protein
MNLMNPRVRLKAPLGRDVRGNDNAAAAKKDHSRRIPLLAVPIT